jgi:hypothetical protein
MTTLTTGALPTETLTDALLALEDIPLRLTVLTLNAVSRPEGSGDLCGVRSGRLTPLGLLVFPERPLRPLLHLWGVLTLQVGTLCYGTTISLHSGPLSCCA